MSKRKGFDPIADANELSQHNFHSAYWINRVTSYTYATWMANKRLAIFVFPFYIIVWYLLLKNSTETASEKHTNILKIWFDFSNSASLEFLVQLLFLFFYTVILVMMVIQTVLAKKPVPEESENKKEEKKKQPKRRKDYGRK